MGTHHAWRKRIEPLKTFQHLDQCVFCNMAFSHQRLKHCHAAACKTIQGLEDRKRCPYCHWETAESQCIAHEPICKKNPSRTNSKMATCANCGVFTYPNGKQHRKQLRIHLIAGCLPFLKECTEKSMKTCEGKWNEGYDPALSKSDSRLLKIKREFNKVIRSKPRHHWECMCCPETFRMLHSFLRHINRCEGLLRRQTMRQCRFCKTSLPEIKSYLHEADCNWAPKEDRWRCFNCNKSFLDKSGSTFRDHVFTCLDICLGFAQEVLDSYYKREDFSKRLIELAELTQKS